MESRSRAALLSLFLILIFTRPVNAAGNILKDHQFGHWNLNFGAEERLRSEYKQDFDFSSSRKDNGFLLYHRLRFNVKATLADKFELFLEGMDLQVGNEHIKKPDQADDFDLHQAYVRMNDVSGLPLDIKAGRQELKYGKGRLIWAATWLNRINHFDAALFHFKTKEINADFFSGLRVGYDDDKFNRPNTHDMINGVYITYQKNKASFLLEPYFLANIDAETPRNLQRYTTGFRLKVPSFSGIDCEIETPYQFGRDKGQVVSAYAIHADASRSFNIFWKPKLSLTYNFASGDEKVGNNRNNTFIPLYQSTHDPYGIMDFFRWQNMQEAATELTLNPFKKYQIILGTNFFWLASNKDSWYDSTGAKLRTSSTGNVSSYVGQEASLVMRYDLNKYINFDSGYAHFFTGSYVKDTGANDDADWVYFQVNLKV